MRLPARLLALAMLAPALSAQDCGPVVDADDCNSPDTVVGLGLFAFDNSTATTDGPDHPGTCDKFGQAGVDNDVWFTWTAGVDGQAVVTTCGLTDVDTKVAVYDGETCVGALLDCNDDDCGLQSTVRWNVAAGSTYKVRIGTFPGSSGGTGCFQIDVCGGPVTVDADLCADAVSLPSPGTYPFDNSAAQTDGPAHPGCEKFGQSQTSTDVWAIWTAPSTGNASVYTCGTTNVDTKIVVYAGSGCVGNVVGCNDDTCSLQSAVQWQASAGVTYKIRIGTFPGAAPGDGCFNLEFESTDLNCEEFDRYEDLTPNDTLTVRTNAHNPGQEQGYVYVYAVDESGAGVAADHLVGQLLVVQGIRSFEYSMNPIDYRAAVADGAATDVDGDNVRDLDGTEYEKTAGELLVPRFVGYDPQRGVDGRLILIGLSGGSRFDTTVDFLVYNDNEDQFSAQHTFYCWEKVPLSAISQVFRSTWLDNFSGDDDDESLGPLEYGWFRLNGRVATSTFYSLPDPAFQAVYVEQIGPSAAADLPFETCTQSGHLLPRAVAGDNSEISDQPSDESCEERLPRLTPASLLLYPEFDNRMGTATILTVTNTSSAEDVRAHFIYVGRYGS